MNKLKSTFLRHNKDHEEKRSQVFINRLAEESSTGEEQPPKVEFHDLSETESKAYFAWWKDLDPFNIGISDNVAVFKFVSRFNLPDDVLEKILFLFQNEKNGLNKEQFFAMLRLISHAQNGRSVNRDLVHLGAPLPRFQTQTTTSPVKPIDNNLLDNNIPSWMISNKPINQADLLLDTPIHTPRQYSHSRSRSVPYATTSISSITPDDRPADGISLSPAVFQFDTIGASAGKQRQQHKRGNHSGHASLNSESLQKIMNNGPSLLLTQGFKPKFIEDEDDTSSIRKYSSNNPFNSNNNPFDTDDSTASTPRQEYLNTNLNSKNILPPPVPPQSTKPSYPKYARRFE